MRLFHQRPGRPYDGNPAAGSHGDGRVTVVEVDRKSAKARIDFSNFMDLKRRLGFESHCVKPHDSGRSEPGCTRWAGHCWERWCDGRLTPGHVEGANDDVVDVGLVIRAGEVLTVVEGDAAFGRPCQWNVFDHRLSSIFGIDRRAGDVDRD